MKRSTIICAILSGTILALVGWIVRDLLDEDRHEISGSPPAMMGVPAINLIIGGAGTPGQPYQVLSIPAPSVGDRTELPSVPPGNAAPSGRTGGATWPGVTSTGEVGSRPHSGADEQRRTGSTPARDDHRPVVTNRIEQSWVDQSASIVASDGGIVFIGDDGRLIANSGDVSSSGIVALDADDSALGSGDSRASGRAGQGRGLVEDTGVGPTDDGSGSSRQADRRSPILNGSLGSVLSGHQRGAATSISGFEDHSVSVRGDDQIVTYDDSNVFLNRDGRINANTGDTDSSGLNAVDVSGSTVRSGNSGDGEGDGEEEAEDEEDQPRSTDRSTALQRSASTAGQRNDADDDEKSPAVATPPTASHGGRAQASVTDEGASTATGDDALVIGADGFDDVSIRTDGKRNIVTYDDSNVVIGGSGAVNAQIGDSDTGGATVMGIKDSDVRAGCEGDLCHSGAP